jgi:hypothetical protein
MMVCTRVIGYRCEFESRSWRGVYDTTLCDQVYQWFSPDIRFPPPIKLTATIVFPFPMLLKVDIQGLAFNFYLSRYIP